MTNVHDLPDEMLIRIFELVGFLRPVCPQAARQVLPSVCKLWHELAQPVLMSEIYLSDHRGREGWHSIELLLKGGLLESHLVRTLYFHSVDDLLVIELLDTIKGLRQLKLDSVQLSDSLLSAIGAWSGDLMSLELADDAGHPLSPVLSTLAFQRVKTFGLYTSSPAELFPALPSLKCLRIECGETVWAIPLGVPGPEEYPLNETASSLKLPMIIASLVARSTLAELNLTINHTGDRFNYKRRPTDFTALTALRALRKCTFEILDDEGDSCWGFGATELAGSFLKSMRYTSTLEILHLTIPTDSFEECKTLAREIKEFLHGRGDGLGLLSLKFAVQRNWSLLSAEHNWFGELETYARQHYRVELIGRVTAAAEMHFDHHGLLDYLPQLQS